MISFTKKITLLFLLLIFALSTGIAVGGYFALTRDIPKVEELKGYRPTKGTAVYADDDTLIGEFKIEKGVFVPLKQIPESLIKAVVAVEDSRFWTHKGLDYIAIARALLKDALAGGIKEGGSTITQQLAKVIFLTPERTIQRKLKEATLAFRIEKHLSKKEILEVYLNKVYFGHGAYGVEMAAMTYFGKSVKNITLPEAALLAGLIKAPNTYSPYNNLEKAKMRQHTALQRMQEEGYISKADMDKAYKQPLQLSSLKRGHDAPNYFLEYVRKYLEDKYGAETVYKGGLKVYTTLNKDMQLFAIKALQDGLREIDKRQGFRGPVGHKDIDPKKELKEKEPFPKVIMNPGDLLTGTVLKVSPSEAVIKARGITGKLLLSDAIWASRLINSEGRVLKEFKNLKLTNILKAGDIIKVRIKALKGKEALFLLEQDPLVEGAIVAIEPSTGSIRAMVGGYDFSKSEFNRATLAKRQPGSAFKPIIYATAMDNGFTPASVIVDEPVSYPRPLLGEWTPENYDHKYLGPTRLREALTYSRNIVTVRLLENLGVKKVIDFSGYLGIEGPFPHDLSLALGTLSVSPLELVSAFSVFANEGVRMKTIAVKYIVDERGDILESNEPEGNSAISPQTAFLVTSMMEDVVKRGTGWRAKSLNRPVAGKTGTTNEYKDAWFVGFTPDLAACVWVGFDDLRPLGTKETGAKAASPIWVNFMKEAINNDEPHPFPIPEGITTAEIDPNTGLLATPETGAMIEFFKVGTAPQGYAEPTKIDRRWEELKNLDID
ncbi:MAG: PBP1A family penicillin-binding protein [Nitrospirae bacterium]|nr:PBP1A family penicillin-binding protein [Nitrospirota bacterium]